MVEENYNQGQGLPIQTIAGYAFASLFFGIIFIIIIAKTLEELGLTNFGFYLGLIFLALIPILFLAVNVVMN